MDFKKVFYGNISGIVLAGIAGILIALLGGGLWALVAQNLLNITTACVVMLFTAKWYPRLVFNFARVAELFRFGWKLLVASLLDTLQHELLHIARNDFQSDLPEGVLEAQVREQNKKRPTPDGNQM
jgi:O-antigen/teichoic acid export membrane protein